jgi:F1F0 ATPase subunit 2
MIARATILGIGPVILPLAIAGFALGIAYFASLRRGVHRLVARHAWLACMAWSLVRVAAAALFFAFAVRWGLPALLAAMAGFLAARTIALRCARRLA